LPSHDGASWQARGTWAWLLPEQSYNHLTCISHPTIVAPTRPDAAAFLAARAEETADDEADILTIPYLSSSRHDVPPCATPFPPEAATPHAGLSLAVGRALSPAPISVPPIECEHRRRAAENGDPRRAALPNGDQRL